MLILCGLFVSSNFIIIIIIINCIRNKEISQNICIFLVIIYKYTNDVWTHERLASSWLSVRPSVRMKQLGSYWRNFHEIWYLKVFRKSAQKSQVSSKFDKNSPYCTRTPIYIYFDTLLSLWWNDRCSDTSCTGNQNTHFVFSNFFSENRSVFEIMWKNIVEPERKNDNMAHAHCMLDNKHYRHTFRICNTNCFPKVTMVMWTQVHVTCIHTIKVNCPPCTDTEALYRPYGP